jgi:C4-dicarboxylate-specific signal transduction histidine kinase
VGSNCIGAIALEGERPGLVADRSLDFLRTLGRYASVAIWSAQLQEKELEARPFEMLGAMLGGFSHVMRNRVNVALNGIVLLQTEGLPHEERITWFAKVKENLDRIESICTDLKRLSGGGEFELSAISVNTLLDPVWENMAERLRVNVSKHLRLDAREPRIVGNASQILVALGMLVQNALEAMPEGGKLIYWTRERGGLIEILIGDNGKGMDKHTRKSCPEPFFTTKTKGTRCGHHHSASASSYMGRIEQDRKRNTMEASVSEGRGLWQIF